jgi:hypothetical protein
LALLKIASIILRTYALPASDTGIEHCDHLDVIGAQLAQFVIEPVLGYGEGPVRPYGRGLVQHDLIRIDELDISLRMMAVGRHHERDKGIAFLLQDYDRTVLRTCIAVEIDLRIPNLHGFRNGLVSLQLQYITP